MTQYYVSIACTVRLKAVAIYWMKPEKENEFIKFIKDSLNQRIKMADLRYQNFEQFQEVFNKVAALERTALSASDYLMYMRERGKQIAKVEILLVKANNETIMDLFGLDGKLKDVGWTLKDRDNWDLPTVYSAYKGETNGPRFDYGLYHFPKELTTSSVQILLHGLEDLMKDGCNLLVSHVEVDRCLRFFNKAIPARVI